MMRIHRQADEFLGPLVQSRKSPFRFLPHLQKLHQEWKTDDQGQD
jgi:hypothetical protein